MSERVGRIGGRGRRLGARRGVEVRQALASHGLCAVEMHVPPVADTVQVTLKVAHVIDTILSVTTLVANGHRAILAQAFLAQAISLERCIAHAYIKF